MSAPTVPPVGAASSAPGSAGRQGWVRRHRAPALAVTAAVLAVVVVALLGGGARTGTPMDPDNPGPGGTQALARVLARDGVDVDVARSADELQRARVDDETTVVVVRPSQLGQSTIDRLVQHTADAAQVVVVGAGPGEVDALGIDDAPERVTVGQGRTAGCADPRFADLTLEVDRAVAYPSGDCFRGREQGREAGLVLEAGPTAGTGAGPGAPLVLFGAEQALTNDQVLRADNAAIALRLLGQHARLVFYVPTVDDLVGDDGVSLASLLPRWIRPGLGLGLLALVALILWRARRLGPLATEPLPVVVRAIETTRSLGRLYRRSGDRGHAAETLRRAARRRLADRLRLGSRAGPDEVLREVARRTGRRPDDLARLLGPRGDVPSTDHDLIALADALATLDDEVPRR